MKKNKIMKTVKKKTVKFTFRKQWIRFREILNIKINWLTNNHIFDTEIKPLCVPVRKAIVVHVQIVRL